MQDVNAYNREHTALFLTGQLPPDTEEAAIVLELVSALQDTLVKFRAAHPLPDHSEPSD